MQNKTRLLLAAGLVLAGWLIGFIMGGGTRTTTASTAKSAEAAAAATRRAELEAMARRVGVPEKIESQFGEAREIDWTRDRLQAAARSILRQGDFLALMRRGIAFTDQLKKDDFPLALEVAEAMKGEDEMAEVIGFAVFLRWVELDARGAGEHLRNTKGLGGWFNFQGGMLAMSWGQSNPVEALAFARTLTDEAQRNEFVEGILKSLARRSPDEALAFAKTHAPELATPGMLADALGESGATVDAEQTAKQMAGLGATDQLTGAAERWAKKDHAAALAWAGGLPDAAQRTKALNGVFGAMVEKDPRAVGAALLAMQRQGEVLDTAVNRVANEWPKDDLPAATAWAGRLADEKERTEAYGALGERLGRDKPEAAAAWLQNLPASPGRDEAVARYTVQIVEKDGPAAMEWASTVSDPAKRNEAMHRVSVDWFRRDAAAAFEWLSTTTQFSPDEKRAMLKAK